MTVYIPSSCIQLLPHPELDSTSLISSPPLSASLRKSAAIRMKHPPLPTRSVNLLAPISTFLAVLSTCGLDPVSSWPPIITHAFFTVHPCHRLPLFCLSISIKTCLCYLPFNTPLTPIHLLWLHVYMHVVTTNCGNVVSMCIYLTSQSFESTPVELSPPTFLCLCLVFKLERLNIFGREVNGVVKERGLCSQAARVKQPWWSLGRQIPMPDRFPNWVGELRTRDRAESFDTLGVNVITKGKYGGKKDERGHFWHLEVDWRNQIWRMSKVQYHGNQGNQNRMGETMRTQRSQE